MNDKIITVQKQHCPICVSDGTLIHKDLVDILQSTKGTWSMKLCNNATCGTYWLDPAPNLESIPLLYKNYTTHTDPLPLPLIKKTGTKKLFDNIRYSVLNKELGYPYSLSKTTKSLLNIISYIHPGWHNEQLDQVLYVPYVENGHLLDVGCGGGLSMITFRDKGWKVTGTDFDNTALDNARKKGFDVYLGDLKTINFSDNSFDAILLSHVIEHVPDPIETLRECHRILKPNGHLVAITPNANSRGHRQFKQYWRGLEVPRHLQIFTPNSLENAGFQAGFKKSEGKTCLQGSQYILKTSEANKKNGTFDLPASTTKSKFFDELIRFIGGVKFIIKPGREETALLYCQK